VVDFLLTFSLFPLGLRRYKAEICRSRRFSKGWVTLSVNFRRRGHRPPTSVGVRKLEWLRISVVPKYPHCIAWFCHKARVWQIDRRTDRQTGRITQLNKIPRSIAARAVKSVRFV